MNLTYKLMLATLCLSPLACSGPDSVDIGDDGTTGTTGAFLSDYAASWDGYAEAYEFPSGSSRVRITLDEEGHGVARFGEAELSAPPTDPDATPPVSQILGVFMSVPLREDFQYSVEHSQVSDSRIQLGVSNFEGLEAWCELQTPFPVSDTYACLPPGGIQFSDTACALDTGSGPIPMDCGKIAVCHMPDVCPCDAQSCTARTTADLATSPTRLDAALGDSGNSLVGTLLVDDERISVRLTRQ